MASSTGQEDDDMEDEAPELNILTSETIRMAVREINRSFPRTPKTRIKLLINMENFFKTVFGLIERKDPRIQRQLLEIIHDLQDVVIGVTNLIVSLSASSAHKQISHIYDTVYNMGAYLENIIIEIYNECRKQKLKFAHAMKDFLYSLMKLSSENGDSWLYSVLISPIVLHVLNSFWCELDENERTDWCYDVEDLMIPLSKAAFTCGDFYCQHYLVTIFYYWVRWAMPGKALPILNSVFQCVEKEVRKELLRVEVEDTEPITRNFLNALNTSRKGPRRVIPISCLYMFVCNTEIRPPDHEVHREMDFWVDFSIVSGRLHAYYSIPDAAALASLSIRRDQIDSVCLNWVVNDSQVEDLEQDGDTQSTFAKDEKVLFFHIVLSVDFDAVASDIESLAGKGYRSIYLVFRSGELVEKLMKDMGYSIHECGTRNCQRPRALRRLLATKHKLSYKESWCPDSQITGLDSTMNETRTSNVSMRSDRSDVSRTSITFTPCETEARRHPSTPFQAKNRRQSSTPSDKENRRQPSTPFRTQTSRHPSTPIRRIRNETAVTPSTSINSFISISVSSQEQDENLSPSDSPNRPAILSLNRSRDISPSASVNISPNVFVNAIPEVSFNASPKVIVNLSPNVSLNPSRNVSINGSPDASVHDSDSPNASAYDTTYVSVYDSPNVSVHDSFNASAHDTTNVATHDSPNVSVPGSPNVSVHDSFNISAHNTTNVSVHDSPNVSVHGCPNVSAHENTSVSVHDITSVSVHDITSVSVHDITSVSVHDITNVSVHDITNVSAHGIRNVSVYESPNTSVHESPNAPVHGSSIPPDLPEEPGSISPTVATNFPPRGSVYISTKGSTVSPLNLKSFNRSLHASPNPFMDVSVTTSCEEPLPPEARKKYAHLYKHVPFHHRQETPKRIKSSKSKTAKLMLVRNSSPKVSAPLQEPVSPPVSEIGSPQHNIFNLTVGADLDATNVSDNEDEWPRTPELSFGEVSDKNDSKDDQALSLSPVFGYSRTLEARGEIILPVTEHQSYEKSVSEPQSQQQSPLQRQSQRQSPSQRQSQQQSPSQRQSQQRSPSQRQSQQQSPSQRQSQQKSPSQRQSLKKSLAQRQREYLKSVFAGSKQQANNNPVSRVSEKPTSTQMNSTTSHRRKHRKTCYANSFNDWKRKMEEKKMTDNYDPYDLWTSSEMDDYKDLLFPKRKIYGARKRKESNRQGGTTKKRRTAKTTTRRRNRFNLMNSKKKNLRRETDSHSLELDFNDENPRRNPRFFKRRD